MPKSNPRVLFIGGFKPANDGAVGGQFYACSTLVNSPIKEHIKFIKIDSTVASVPPPALIVRVIPAISRVLKVIYFLSSSKVDSVLVFTAHGASLLEKGLIVFIARLFRKKTVTFPRSGFLIDECKRSRFWRWYTRMVFRHSNWVVCQGDYWRQGFIELLGLPEGKFITIMNWLDISEYNSLFSVAPDNGELRILFMGWVDQDKGIIEFVNSIAKLRSRLGNVRVTIAGKGNALDAAKNLVGKYQLEDYVNFPGWVIGDKKEELIKRSHIFVLPSYAEGMPNALLEAMAAKKAVISTSVGAIPDVLKNFENGLLIPPRDEDALTRALETCIEDRDLVTRLSENARKSIEKNHDIESAWVSVFRLLDGSRV
ncbi:MAG: glycosyltransferase family 4 protein [Gammaproteobacteria bacterium]|nr:glycosyltransferase family 4 protein [Gammaproteobacteria bacterium]